MVGLVKQHDSTDCGPACIISIANYYGTNVPIPLVRRYAETNQEGTSIAGLIEAAEILGFEAAGLRCEEAEMDRICLPAIFHINIDKNIHHFVTVCEISQRKVTIMDPAHGRLIVQDRVEFLKTWTGILINVVPSAHYQPLRYRQSKLQDFNRLIRPVINLLSISILAGIIYTGLSFSTAYFLRKILDGVIPSSDLYYLHQTGIVMLSILLIQALMNMMRSWSARHCAKTLDKALIMNYYQRLMKLPQRFFDTMSIGEISSRLNDAVKIRYFLNDFLINLVINVLVITLSLTLMFTIYWKLAAVMLTAVPLNIMVFYFTDKTATVKQRVLASASAKLESHLIESLGGMKSVKALRIESLMTSKMEANLEKLLYSANQSARINQNSINISEIISKLVTLGILWLGTCKVLGAEISQGELLSFFAFTIYFTSPIAALSNFGKVFREAKISADRLFDLQLAYPIEHEELRNIEAEAGDIDFVGVQFRYDLNRPVFKDLNLKIKSGKCTAITGGNGSGKSSLVNLLQDIYQPQKGYVLLNGTALTKVRTASLSKIIGIVPQRIELFEGSLLENISIGYSIPDRNRIEQLCQEVELSTLIEKLPDGLNTYIGPSGTGISGGEKQKIALARALYCNPEILILDEATSAVDSKTLHAICKVIERLKSEQKTILIIAHHDHILSYADEVITLDNGTAKMLMIS